MQEKWKEFHPRYSVSNLGRIKRHSYRQYNSLTGTYSVYKEKIMKTFLSPTGYERVTLVLDGKQCKKAVHRIVAEAFVPNPENKPTVDHINGVRNDNRAINLRWFTNAEQQIHRKDVFPVKATKGDVVITGVSQQDLADKIGDYRMNINTALKQPHRRVKGFKIERI